MATKTILACVSSEESGHSILDAAGRLAKEHDAHIEVLHVRADPRGLVPYTGEGMDGSMIEEIMEVTEKEGGERSVRVKAQFDAFCQSSGIAIADTPGTVSGPTICWREENGREDEIVAIRGRLFDIIACGRPVKEATHAISASMPLLAKAGKVTLLAADPIESPDIPPEDGATRLAWGGIKAEVLRFDVNADEIGRAYLKHAREIGADMLVKGAYSRSRVRQMILGGRTRHIIANTEIPTFLCK